MAERSGPSERSAYKEFRTLTTRWMDNDPYGHMNNVVHYSLFDTAVNGWLIEQGVLDFIAGKQVGLVVETGCRYFAPLTYPGFVEVGIAVDRMGSSSVTYRTGVFGQGADEAAAEGHFTHVYVDRGSRRPAPLPAEWRAKLERLA